MSSVFVFWCVRWHAQCLSITPWSFANWHQWALPNCEWVRCKPALTWNPCSWGSGSQPACLDRDHCHLSLKERWGKLLTCFEAKYSLLFLGFERAYFYLTKRDQEGCLEGDCLFSVGTTEGKRQQRELLSLTYRLERLQWATRNRQTSALPVSAS